MSASASSLPKPFKTTIAPNLSVANGSVAVAFYKAAFGAVELYRLEAEDGQVVIAQLSVRGAEFWLVQADETITNSRPSSAIPPSIRLLLSVEEPDAFFAQALAAGAREVYGVHEEHGWRSGVVVDPDGYWWEIARPVVV